MSVILDSNPKNKNGIGMGIKIGQTVGANKTGGKCLKKWIKSDRKSIIYNREWVILKQGIRNILQKTAQIKIGQEVGKCLTGGISKIGVGENVKQN